MTSTHTEADLELEYDAHLGEGPVWDESEQKLYWVDILSGKIFRYDPRRNSNEVFEIGEHVGAVALREKGGLVMAMKTGFAFFDPDKDQIRRITDPESEQPDHRFNDGKCDPAGRFWAGTLSYGLEEGSGNLYLLNGDLSVEHKLDGLTIPNGMAWNRERNKFYLIDSVAGSIFSYGYDDAGATLSNREVLRSFDKQEGAPDGMCIDREGQLWVALYDGGKVIRVDADEGTTLYEIHLPVPKPTSCTFGGPGLSELFITTAREYMTEEDIRTYPLSGSLFKAKVPVKGLAPDRFNG